MVGILERLNQYCAIVQVKKLQNFFLPFKIQVGCGRNSFMEKYLQP